MGNELNFAYIARSTKMRRLMKKYVFWPYDQLQEIDRENTTFQTKIPKNNFTGISQNH